MRHAADAEAAVVGIRFLDVEDDPLEHLRSLAVTLDDTHMDAHGIPGPNFGPVLASGQLEQIG
jgi:hypothetical protein